MSAYMYVCVCVSACSYVRCLYTYAHSFSLSLSHTPGLRLYTGPAYDPLNNALRHGLYQKGKRHCLPRLPKLSQLFMNSGELKGPVSIHTLTAALGSAPEFNKYFSDATSKAEYLRYASVDRPVSLVY